MEEEGVANGHEFHDTPPPYSESHVHIQRTVKRSSTPPARNLGSSIPSETPEVKLEPPPPPAPPSAQRVRAPMVVKQQNSSIVTSLVVLPPLAANSPNKPETDEPAPAPMSPSGGPLQSIVSMLSHKPVFLPADPPHIFLKTTHTKIDSTLHITDADWGGPFTASAATTHSRVTLALQPSNPQQAVNVRVSTSHAHAKLLLPSSFHGLLVLSTVHSRCVLSPALRERSIRLADGGQGGMPDHAECYEIGGPGGPSRAEVRTNHAKAEAGIVGEEVQTDESSCNVM